MLAVSSSRPGLKSVVPNVASRALAAMPGAQRDAVDQRREAVIDERERVRVPLADHGEDIPVAHTAEVLDASIRGRPL